MIVSSHDMDYIILRHHMVSAPFHPMPYTLMINDVPGEHKSPPSSIAGDEGRCMLAAGLHAVLHVLCRSWT